MQHIGRVKWADIEEDDDDWMDEMYAPSLTNKEPSSRDIPKLPETKIDDGDIKRWMSWTKPFPLPDYLSPQEGGALQNIDDDILLTAPPHLLAHILRTSAQGGLQVVSPRQTPITCMMNRVNDTHRELGDHVVGSLADSSGEWPTIDDADFSELLPDEPLPPIGESYVVRERTRTEPLTRASGLLKDPILSCLVKGRAVIDVQQRDDVMGDDEGLTDLLAAAWGIDKEQLMDLDAFTLGVDGPLLRHAIKSDDVYPILHAPIHMMRSVGVGSNEVTREVLPPDSAMDWRRMRVFCEAVYLMCAVVEGIPLGKVKANPPPGDPTAPLNRRNILAFRPSPCIAWSFEGKGFSICPTQVPDRVKMSVIPQDVMEALARYTKIVRPMSYALAAGHKAVTKVTSAYKATVPEGESLSHAYETVSKQVLTGSSRGKTAAATVRNLIHDAIEAAPLKVRLRLARYLRIAKTETQIHLGVEVIPDVLIDRIASKFLLVGESIRLKVASEAGRRGKSVSEWWEDVTSQTPARYRDLPEGTMGWAKVGMWLTFRAPTEKWDKMEKAIHYKAVREGEVTSIGGIPLPPEKGSMERIMSATREGVKRITSAYFGYYVAVADIGMAIADILVSRGEPRRADILREAAYTWILRARMLRGTNVMPIGKSDPTPSMNHLRVSSPNVDILVVPAPYRAFTAYKSHVLSSEVVHKNVKTVLMAFEGTRVSDFFRSIKGPLAPARESVLTRYVIRPVELADDMEKAWCMLTEDVKKIVYMYGVDQKQAREQKKRPVSLIPAGEDVIEASRKIMKQVQKPGMGYYDIIGVMDVDEVDWFDDMLMKLSEGVGQSLIEARYNDADHLRDVFLKIQRDMDLAKKRTKELVN